MQAEAGLFEGDVRRDLSAPLAVSFPGPTNFSQNGRTVAFSVQDTFRVVNDTGWLFRSGEFPDDLPAEPVEIVTAKKLINDADVAGALPALPFTVDASTGTVLTAITATIGAGGIDVVASGTTNAVGPTVRLTLTTTLTVAPSADVLRPEQGALYIVPTNTTVGFAPGSNLASNASVVVLELFKPVLIREFRPLLRARLESLINAAILTQIPGATPGGTLPEGVILSIRSVTIRTPTGAAATMEVRGALGAFGGVINKLVPAGSASGSQFKCFVATVVRGEDSPDVAVLRRFRDTVLVRHAAGRAFVVAYGAVGPWLAAAAARSPVVRRAADLLIVRPGVWIAKGQLDRHNSSISSYR
jgi:hypothetical protein